MIKEVGGPPDASQVFHVLHTVGHLPYTSEKYMNAHIQCIERGNSLLMKYIFVIVLLKCVR